MTTTPFHPATQQVLRWFEFGHLRQGPLRDTSERFARIAYEIAGSLPQGPELTTALRKLLEAKDCAVRAALDIDPLKPWPGLRPEERLP